MQPPFDNTVIVVDGGTSRDRELIAKALACFLWDEPIYADCSLPIPFTPYYLYFQETEVPPSCGTVLLTDVYGVIWRYPDLMKKESCRGVRSEWRWIPSWLRSTRWVLCIADRYDLDKRVRCYADSLIHIFYSSEILVKFKVYNRRTGMPAFVTVLRDCLSKLHDEGAIEQWRRRVGILL